MGMYDNIIIDKELLPITPAERAKIGPEPGWQTKDICDPGMDTYYLREDSIFKQSFYMEEDGDPVPRMIRFRYTGDIRFYTRIGDLHDIKSIFMEFLAVYADSRLISIERVGAWAEI